ncbi:MAG: winged helix-turn-helix domain-containing protein [Acidimicrobiales bacterium]
MRSSRPSAVRMSAAQARRAALAAQGFVDPRPKGPITRRHLARVIDRVNVVQIDSINVLTRSHELPFFSRLGPYPRALLPQHIERHRRMFEYWGHVASFVPIDLHPLLRWRMERNGAEVWGASRRDGRFAEYIEAVYDQVAVGGPMVASELEDGGEKGGPSWGRRDGKVAIEYLFASGRVTAAGRRGTFERLYDLPERVIPPEILARPAPDEHEAHRQLLLLSARSLGVATDRDLADYFRLNPTIARPRLAELVEAGSLVPVEVDGWPATARAYVHPDAKVPRRVDATALLSMFDSLVWERARTERIFGMRYRTEVYTPPPKRVHGYYVLPFLLGDELVARVDLKADRQASVLRVPGAYAEPPHEAAAIAGPLAAHLRTMADWLELESVDIGERGDLAAELRR